MRSAAATSSTCLSTLPKGTTRSATGGKVARLPLGVAGVAAVAAGDRVLAISGGDDDKGWVTPATWALGPRGWERLADLAVPRHGHAAAAANGRAFVFGGAPCAGYGKTDSVETVSLRP